MEAKKFDEEKPRIDLVPPSLFKAVGAIMGYGKNKYGAHNWRKGIMQGRLYGAALRHLTTWQAGEDKDPESNRSHLWHAAANLGMMIENEELRPELDDRYKLEYSKVRSDLGGDNHEGCECETCQLFKSKSSSLVKKNS